MKFEVEASFMQDIFQTSTICTKHYSFSALYKCMSVEHFGWKCLEDSSHGVPQ